MILLVLHSPLNVFRLSDDERIIDIGGLKVSEDPIGFINTALGHEPSR